MALTGPLELSGSQGTTKIYSTTGSIQPGYNKAAAINTSGDGTLWVVYTVKNWDHDHPGDRCTEHIVDPNTGSANVDPENTLSAQGFNVSNPGIILFEHSQYRGYGQLNTSDNPDLTQSFSQGSVSGVSSAIVTGGVWTLYKGFNYTGTQLGGEIGPGRHDFGFLTTNDLAKSIKYVRPS